MADRAERRAPHVIKEWGRQIQGMPACESPKDLDCIESLRVFTGGRWAVAQFVSSERISWTDAHLGKGDDVILTWQYDSATERGVYVQTRGRMQPRGVLRDGANALDHGMLIHVDRRVDTEHPYTQAADLECASGEVDTCILGLPRLPPDDFFEIVARTSWLKDNQAYVAGLDMAIRTGEVRGGTRWTFGARQTLVPKPAKWDEVTPAVGWVASLHFGVDHAGDGLHDSAWDPRCAEFGAPWKSTNAAGSGRLRWNVKAQSVEFQIFSPHLNPHGQPYVGDFTAFIPLKWLKCFTGQSIRPGYLSVQVVDENGDEQAATTSVRVQRGTVHVRATGFHFSRPSIRLSTAK